MALWIYLIGVIAAMMLCFGFIYMDWSNGNDTKLSDILRYVCLSLGSWLTLIVVIMYKISSFLDEHSNVVVIKGKKQ